MARQWRIQYEGAYYHVLSRGNERKDIFRDAKDRLAFLSTLGEMAKRFEVEIYAYVLMSNHYHLLLKTNRGNLSKAMQWLGLTYTTRFNLRNARSGHLFQGRFKSMMVENEAYLMELSCYIHRNPVRARIVKRLMDYRWSSYPAYAYGKEHGEWLKTDLILWQMGGRDRHLAYREKVQRYAGEEKKVFEELRHGFLLGSAEFVEKIKTGYLSKQVDREMPEQRKVLAEDLVEVIRRGARALNLDLNRIEKEKRIGRLDKESRDLLIYVVWESGRYRGKDIGEVMGLGYSSISRRAGIVKRRVGTDKAFEKKVEKMKSIIKM